MLSSSRDVGTGRSYSASSTDSSVEGCFRRARVDGTRLATWRRGSQSSKHGGTAMNQDVLSGKWKQKRGQVKQWWGKLTDDDLDRIDGTMDKLVGTLQERYGWERDQAEREMKKRFEGYESEMRDPTRR